MHEGRPDARILVKVNRVDDEGTKRLRLFAFRLNDTLKLCSMNLVKEVSRRWFVKRMHDLGDRLAKFLSDGGCEEEGVLNWKFGCYRFEWDESDQLKEMVHISGNYGHNFDGVKKMLDRKVAKLQDNWSDFHAHWEVAGVPPLYVHKYFAKGKGPHRYFNFGSKAKAFEDSVKPVYDAYMAEVVAATKEALQSASEEKASEAFKSMKHDKQKAKALEARQKALSTLQAKKARRAISMAV